MSPELSKAAKRNAMRSALLKMQCCGGGLIGTACCLVYPDYYLWSLAALASLLVGYFMLTIARNKRLLLASYALTVIFSFTVGRIFFDGYRLVGVGFTLMFFALSPGRRPDVYRHNRVRHA